MNSKRKGKILVFSAPSGSGKTSIVKSILNEFPQIVFSVSATTRKKRENEKDRVDYLFLNKEEFEKKIESKEFIEWEKVYDYYYGTSKNFVENAINSGRSIILEIDVNGALSIKKHYPEAVLIFVEPPSFEELSKRLQKRNTESEDDLLKRVQRAKMELSLKDNFDYLITNKDLDVAVKETKNLIKRIINEE